jgi:hypothetical protein
MLWHKKAAEQLQVGLGYCCCYQEMMMFSWFGWRTMALMESELFAWHWALSVWVLPVLISSAKKVAASKFIGFAPLCLM